MISPAAFILFSFIVWSVRSEQECSFRSDTETGYKASWVYDAQNKRVQFTIEAKQRVADNFWTGIGFGRTMSKGDMIIISSNGGRLSASDRHGSGYSEPAVDGQQDVQNFVGRIDNGVVYATFNRLVNTNDREDNPLEDPNLNNCQFFMFPITGGTVNANTADRSKLTLEKHISTPTTKLICNISRCTNNAEGQHPTTPTLASALNNRIDEVARDAVTANRTQTSRPQQPNDSQPPSTAAVPQPAASQPGVPQPGAPQAAPDANPAPRTPTSPAAGVPEAAPGACEYVDGKYKAQWYYTEATKRLTFTINTPLAPGRWTGIGFGQQMQNGDMIIIQDNNGVKASDRHGTGHVEPAIDAHQDIEAFKGSVNGGILQATFNRLLNTNDKDDLAIDDEAQNNCQYFMFPVAGGSTEEQGKIQVHDSVPKVKLICNAKSCKKPVDATPVLGGGQAGEEGATSPIAPGNEGASARPGVGVASGAAGQPSATTPAGGRGGVIQPGGEQEGPEGTTHAAGNQPGAGPDGRQPATGTAAGQNAVSGGQVGTSGQAQPGAEGAAGQGPSKPCPARKDHHLCAQYVDDYLSVVYSRFPKTDVITNKACGLLATNQEGVVLRECCHYLSTHCGRFIDQYIGGIAGSQEAGNAAAPAPANAAAPTPTPTPAAIPVAAGGNPAAGASPALASNTSERPVAGSNNGAAGIAGRGGPTASATTPPTGSEELEEPAGNSPVSGQKPPANANPAPNTAPAANSGPNPADINPKFNPTLAPNPNPVAAAGDRGPEVQPGAPSPQAHNPNPAAGASNSPNSPEAKSPISGKPNGQNQPDTAANPAAKP